MTGYTLTVPEEVYRRVQQIAQATAQPVDVVLLEYLQRLAEAVPVLAAEEEVELQALRYLSDDALWALMREQMAAETQARLQTLMDKNSRGEADHAGRAPGAGAAGGARAAVDAAQVRSGRDSLSAWLYGQTPGQRHA